MQLARHHGYLQFQYQLEGWVRLEECRRPHHQDDPLSLSSVGEGPGAATLLLLLTAVQHLEEFMWYKAALEGLCTVRSVT